MFYRKKKKLGRKFLGQNFLSRRNIPPEDLLRQILRQPPTRATLALRDIENAVMFLKNQLIEGTVPNTAMANQALRGDFTPPPNATPEDIAFYKELNQIGSRLNTARLLQEKGMRGLFQKYQTRGADG